MRADGTAGDGAVVLARRDVRAPHVGDDDDDGARIDVAFATRDDEADGDDDGATTRTSRGVVVSYATSARASAARRADARGRFEARALRVEGATGERTAWASGTRATGTRRLAAAFGREARVVTDDDEEAVVFEANVLAMCFTRGGAMACAMDDGRVATRSASGGDAGTRRAREGGAKRAIVSAEDGEDGACGAVAVCFDGESVVYVARAAVDEAVDALRHPARARATSWRGGTLATLCADGALRLWMRANGRTELTCTIQTPRGGLVPVVAFDWLETSETSDSLYDHAVIGADGASGIHVWTLSDVDAAHPLSARRPVVSHRGSMTFERAMDLTLADGVVIRGSLTQSDDDVRVLLASRRLGVVVARAARDRPNVLEKLYGVSLRDTRPRSWTRACTRRRACSRRRTRPECVERGDATRAAKSKSPTKRRTPTRLRRSNAREWKDVDPAHRSRRALTSEVATWKRRAMERGLRSWMTKDGASSAPSPAIRKSSWNASTRLRQFRELQPYFVGSTSGAVHTRSRPRWGRF